MNSPSGVPLLNDRTRVLTGESRIDLTTDDAERAIANLQSEFFFVVTSRTTPRMSASSATPSGGASRFRG